jgi:hypothetical protein
VTFATLIARLFVGCLWVAGGGAWLYVSAQFIAGMMGVSL